jgi:hypothetical protein
LLKDGQAHLFAMFDLDPAANEIAFNDWYNEEHVSERLACPGFIHARRFRAVSGSPQYLTTYGVESLAALETPQYLSLMSSVRPNADASPLTKEMVGAIRLLNRNIFREIDLTKPYRPPA